MEGDLSDNEHIQRMQKQISDCQLKMQELWEKLTSHLEDNASGNFSLLLAKQYRHEQESKDKYISALINLYQKELQSIEKHGSQLNADQQEAINIEMKNVEKLSNKGYRSGKFWTAEDIPDDLFMTFLDEIIENCPLVTSMIECLVVSSKRERNIHKTSKYKMLCASQSLSVLLNIRNSKAMNDFVLFFGMLCISFGASKQFINMLSSLGLSLHWDTL